MVIGHITEEERGLWGEGIIHLLRGFDLILGGAHRERVAFFEFKAGIVDMRILDASSLELLFEDLRGDRGDVFPDLLAVRGDHLWGVVITAHFDVAEFDVVLEAELLGHLVADFDQLVIDILDLIFDGGQIAVVGFAGFLTGFAV